MAKDRTKFLKAILIGLGGVVLFSLKAVLAKLIYTYEIDAVSVLLFRMVFALPFYIAVLLIDQRKNPLEIKPQGLDYLKLMLFGLLGYYLASLLDFMGLQYIKAGLERVILFIYPTIVILLTWIFLRKKPSNKQILAILVTYVGVFICYQGELSSSLDSGLVVRGCLLVFLAAVTFAAYLVGTEYLVPKFGAIKFTGYAMIFACTAVISHFLIVADVSPFGYHPMVYVYSLIMAIFCTVIPSFLVSISIKEIGANNFGIIAALGPITTIVLAFVILHESLTFIQLIGAFVVMGGILIVSRK